MALTALTEKMTPLLREKLASYEAFHQTSGNKATHFVGIPMIVWGIFAMLGKVSLGPVNAALILMVFGLVWSLRLDIKSVYPYAFFVFFIYCIAVFTSFKMAVALFVVGWAIQYYGHIKYEKKSPAFYTNLQHLLIGPLWIYCFVKNKILS